jgi:hypothetical protein
VFLLKNDEIETQCVWGGGVWYNIIWYVQHATSSD